MPLPLHFGKLRARQAVSNFVKEVYFNGYIFETQTTQNQIIYDRANENPLTPKRFYVQSGYFIPPPRQTPVNCRPQGPNATDVMEFCFLLHH
jgi:hypothetical protein